MKNGMRQRAMAIENVIFVDFRPCAPAFAGCEHTAQFLGLLARAALEGAEGRSRLDGFLPLASAAQVQRSGNAAVCLVPSRDGETSLA